MGVAKLEALDELWALVEVEVGGEPEAAFRVDEAPKGILAVECSH